MNEYLKELTKKKENKKKYINYNSSYTQQSHP